MPIQRIAVRIPKVLNTLLLDLYPNAAVAYSLRKLRNTYTGNAIRVRRSSDNAEQDFGFVNNVLDTASLLTFCGAGNGFITTWYDQSGNNRNAIKTTAVNQPRIVINGAVVTVNAQAAIKMGAGFSEINLEMPAASYLYNQSQFYGISVSKTDGAGGSAPTIVGIYNSSNYKAGILHSFTVSNRYQIGGRRTAADALTSVVDNTNLATNQTLLIGHLNYSTGIATINTNNNAQVQNNSFLTGTMDNTSGAAADNIGGITFNQWYNGKIQEIIIYATNQSANVNGFKSNINTFYSIYSSAPTWDGTQSGLLNTYPNAATAYSLRALNSAYTGPLIRVRRSSDNSEIDIFALQNGGLDNTFLLNFVGVGNGFVTTWYDQSGNGNNGVQATANNQPQIVSNGSMITVNSKNAITFNNRFLTHSAGGSQASNISVFAVRNMNTYPNTYRTLFNYRNYGITYNSTGGSQYGTAHIFSAYGTTKSDNYPTTNGQALDFMYGTSNLERNNSVATLSLGSNYSPGAASIGSQNGTLFTFNAEIQELIIYESNQNTNKSGIKSNINTYYSIY